MVNSLTQKDGGFTTTAFFIFHQSSDMHHSTITYTPNTLGNQSVISGKSIIRIKAMTMAA
ncbi:hypothetical protein LV84_00302 [Algoriphagus ratkowskyi]|uniref:Uncharacterized protein n=1 Tax=Algoriphagus ratkowskyi TaxID=57028 RepID=A0A2W7RLQ0_9BACT|nr:hypothetical protein LV84_00302 [Algoriphagus ratkowskyi]